MQVEVVCVEKYSKSEITLKQNQGKKFRSYLADGYYVAKRTEDGFYILRQRSKILVTVRWQEGEKRFEKRINMKNKLRKLYGKLESWKLIELFKEELAKNSVAVEMDSRGYFAIVKK